MTIQKRQTMVRILPLLLLGLLWPPLQPATLRAQDHTPIRMFFPRGGERLAEEIREIDPSGSPNERAGRLVRELLAGPRTDLEPAFFPGTRLGQVFVDHDGTAYVDLDTAGVKGQYGLVQERLALWSLVNTLCYNLSEVQAVKVLVSGGEARTLFGHVDIGRPLRPDDGLIE
ncbi:MAG: GerMN domain-containing protein [Proteobacteria bacterium]|nr:GerMN domain-containing protein [Pseudomonadota bacterium]